MNLTGGAAVGEAVPQETGGPSVASDRLPEERNPASAIARSEWIRPQSDGQQDRIKRSISEYASWSDHPTPSEWTNSPYVYPSSSDSVRPLLNHLWQWARKRAGQEDVRPHDLRHIFVCGAVIEGVPLPVVACLLSHKNGEGALRYAHAAWKPPWSESEFCSRRFWSVPESRPNANGGQTRCCAADVLVLHHNII